MSEDDHQQQPLDETKQEDFNAPINIKVRFYYFFFVFSLFLLGVFLYSFFMVSYLLGREFHWRRSFFQNQTKHQTYKATRRLCQQSGKRCRQYSVSFSFFYNLILLSIMDPCTRDLLLDRSKTFMIFR